MANVYRQIYKEIKKNNNIIIARHIGADPDALGSQFALKEIIKTRFPHKNVYAIGKPSARFKFMGSLDQIDEELDKRDTLLIVLDTPDIKRIDGINIEKYSKIIKIDHHPVVDDFGNIKIVDDTASSASQLILEFALKRHLKITEIAAKNLYIGIVSDTGRFMHGYTTMKTFMLVSKLIKKTNLDFTSLYSELYMRPQSEIKFQGYIYKNMTITPEGLAYIKITDEMLKEFCVDSASAGNIISEINCIENVFVWIFLTEDKKSNLIRANIRSRGPYINEIASIYGGGGHKLASGARLISWNQADNLIEDLNKLCENYQRTL